MALALSMIRLGLYGALFLFSFILFCLCAARLNYTLHLPRGDPLNNGRDFYDPDIAFLLFCSLLILAWAPFMIHVIYGRREYKYASRVWHELLGTSILWFIVIIGTSIATSFWGALGWCQEFEACRVLSALVAFAWLTWLTLTALLVLTLLFGLANRAWTEPAHGRWVVDDASRRSSRNVPYRQNA